MNPGTILLVEDNESDIALTQRALKQARILNDMVVVQDGEEALDYIFARGRHAARQQGKFPDLILLDLSLPKVSGAEVLQELKSNEVTRKIPVVVLTTSSEETDVNAAYKLGANSFILKPVDFQQFAGSIAQIGLYWLVLNHPPASEA